MTSYRCTATKKHIPRDQKTHAKEMRLAPLGLNRLIMTSHILVQRMIIAHAQNILHRQRKTFAA
ncbi:MAG TPA: hypothetical protein VGC86_11715 [Afipia sp.]